ncbi:hypothetical protein OVY01_08270 [Robbsia sp. Bb-Pol-6]|uniref:Effector protein BipC n=2 Tax=Robbsia betulipollinis TaxID=2981849 RepID=A0ABT3ZLK9_9BURK|nr:hypothetical protein [Robbsia betulipollinis]
MNIASEVAGRLELYRLGSEHAADAARAGSTPSTQAGAAVSSRNAVGASDVAVDTPVRDAAATFGSPRLLAPSAGAAQRIAPSEIAALALPLAQGSDALGNAFVDVLTRSAGDAGHAGGSESEPSSGFLMDDARIDILLMMSTEWQKAQMADRKLQSEMTTVATKAAMEQSNSQIAAGNDAFATAVSSSALNVGMQVMSTTIRVRALNKEHASLKVNTQNGQDAHGRENIINRAVRSAEAVRPSEIDTVTVGSGANKRTLRLEEDRVRAPARDAARMSEPAMSSAARSANVSTHHALNQRAWGRDYAKADLWHTGADVSAKMVDGVGQMEQSKEHARQTVQQNQQEVARSDASLHEESARQSRAIAQEMHNISNQLINNIGSVAAQIAGNLRV